MTQLSIQLNKWMEVWLWYLWFNADTTENIICRNIFLIYIYRMYHIEPNLHIPLSVSRRYCKFWGCCMFSFIAALIIQCQIVALLQWAWLLLLRYLFLHWKLYLYLLSCSSFPRPFLALFYHNKFVSALFIEAFAFSWEIVLRSFLKISSQLNG